MESAQWCFFPGLVHTWYRRSDNRRRLRATRPCAFYMLSRQRKLEWFVRIRNSCPLR